MLVKEVVFAGVINMVLIVRATIMALRKKDSNPCAKVSRRVSFDETATSDT